VTGESTNPVFDRKNERHADQPMGLIDIHSHLYPDWYLDAMRARDVAPRVERLPNGEERFVIFPAGEGPTVTLDYSQVDRKLAYMSQLGIDQSVISLGNPWLQWVRPESLAVEYADRLNGWLSTLAQSTDQRLVGMGVLPEADPEQTASYARRLKEHKVVGVAIGSTLCGRELDDPDLFEVYAELQAAGLPLFIHPHHSLDAGRLKGYGPSLHVALGFPTETALAVARLLLGGVLDAFPNLSIVAAHGGGALPGLASRLLAASARHLPNEDPLGTHITSLEQIYVDSIIYDPKIMELLVGVFGEGRIMFGTDHPYYVAHHPAVKGVLDTIENAELHQNIRSETARRLFSLPEYPALRR
jgi:aminocarboxymuconate-semialdehyde decarboxylase